MQIQVRPADFLRDRAAMIDLFRRHLWPESTERRFDWLYRDGPHGTARAWLAHDAESDAVVGAAAAFPRKMRFHGKPRNGWVLGDFCMDERYRTLGPALQLQRACLEPVNATASSFCYDFPSQKMMAIYKRLGIACSGMLVRWARPLRLTPRIESLVRSRLVARALAIPAEAILAFHGWKGKKSAAQIELHVGPCGDEFSRLNEQVREQRGVFTDRTSEYLNWRYLADPSARYEILAARRSGSLVGYAIFGIRGEEGRIVDLCALEEPALVALLLAETIKRVSARGATVLSMNAGEKHPWNGIFARVGFRRREASPVVTYTGNNHPLFEASGLPAWYLMQGERDS